MNSCGQPTIRAQKCMRLTLRTQALSLCCGDHHRVKDLPWRILLHINRPYRLLKFTDLLV